jgi:hypothetical protein
MLNETCFAVHGNGGPNRFPAECFINALHSQAHTQDRDFITKGLNQLNGNPRVYRVLGSRTDKDVIGVKRFDFFYRYLVTSMNINFEFIVHEHLHKVVCKGIVVIDDQQFWRSHIYLEKKATQTRVWVAFAYGITQLFSKISYSTIRVKVFVEK